VQFPFISFIAIFITFYVTVLIYCHSNIATTEMFYLKESSADVAKRANIPWLTKPEKQDNLPKFLVSSGLTQTNSAVSAGAQLKEKQDRERKRRMKNMAKIGGFTVKTSLESFKNKNIQNKMCDFLLQNTQ